MISKKMENMVKNGSAIRAMFEEGKKMAEKYGAENVYDFSLGNPSVEPPIEIKNAINEHNAELKASKEQLTNMVPYRALAGFFQKINKFTIK